MAHPTRRARLGSRNSVIEDLRLVREIGGVNVAGAEELAGTLAALRARAPEGLPPEVETARQLIASHVLTACKSVIDEAQSDVAQIATAQSVQTLLLRDVGSTEKHADLRRKVLRLSGCKLTTDALRKREDTLLGTIAKAVLHDIEHRDWPSRRVSTIEELFVAGRGTYHHTAELLHDLGMQFYPLGHTDFDADTVRHEFGLTLFNLGELLWMARTASDLADRGQVSTSGQTALAHKVFSVAAQCLLAVEAREQLADAYQNHRADRDSFVAAVDDGSYDQLTDALVDWLACCRPKCAYQRSHLRELLCPLHQCIMQVRDMEWLVDEVASGRWQVKHRVDDNVLRHIDDGSLDVASRRPVTPGRE